MPNNEDNEIREKRRKIFAIVTELRSRGVPIPPEILEQMSWTSRTKAWRVDDKGYFIGIDGRNFNANAVQKAIIDDVSSRFIAFIAGRGAGKSSTGAQKALKKISEGKNGVVLNPDFENFKISTWPEFRQWIPWDNVIPSHRHRRQPDWIPNGPFQMVFENGVTVICKGLKDEDSGRGPNVNWLWYDEAGRDRTGISWKNAIASVRIGVDAQSFITTTPKGVDHWIYKFFVKKEIPQDALDLMAKSDRQLLSVYYSSLYDNMDNLDPTFAASLLASYTEGWLRRQEIFGEFVSAEGSIGTGAAEAIRNHIIYAPPENVIARVRFWDLAATEKKMVNNKVVNDPDETVGTLGSWDKKNTYIEDQVCGFWSWADIKTTILETAKRDGAKVRVVVEQEPAAGGKNQVAELMDLMRIQLPGWPLLEGWNPRDAGDRVMGANTWFAEAVSGNVLFLQGAWNTETITQIASFPVMNHDDRVTSITGCRYSLAPIKKWKEIEYITL